jgi:uncharacterized damage-inducible protein DinB
MGDREVERTADQLRRAFEGNAWHGPALSEVLSDVTSAQAAKKPLRTAHSIWEIVLHIAVWEPVVRRRLAGEVIVELPPEQDWPPVKDTSENAWRSTLAALKQGNQQLREAILELSDERLSEPVPAKGYSMYVMLHGAVQHELYHAGQIAILKKAR